MVYGREVEGTKQTEIISFILSLVNSKEERLLILVIIGFIKSS